MKATYGHTCIFWILVSFTIPKESEAARNYADYDHDYEDAYEKKADDTLASWLIAVIVCVCIAFVVTLAMMIVCCMCCSRRRVSPVEIAYPSTGSGTIYLTALTCHHPVPTNHMVSSECTNAAFTITDESNTSGSPSELQTVTQPPPYSEFPNIKQ